MRGALVLACGNTLRGDDGVGWWIAGRVEQYFSATGIEVEFVRQFTPEFAEPVSAAALVVFVDCSMIAAPGAVSVLPVYPAENLPRVLTHHLDPSAVLKLARDLYGAIPERCYAVTVGGKSFELSEELSDPVAAAIPTAVELIGRLLRTDRAKTAGQLARDNTARVRIPMAWPAARR